MLGKNALAQVGDKKRGVRDLCEICARLVRDLCARLASRFAQLSCASPTSSPTPCMRSVLSGPACGCSISTYDVAVESSSLSSAKYTSVKETAVPCSSTLMRPSAVHGLTLMRKFQCHDSSLSFHCSRLFTVAHLPPMTSDADDGNGAAAAAERETRRRSETRRSMVSCGGVHALLIHTRLCPRASASSPPTAGSCAWQRQTRSVLQKFKLGTLMYL